LRRIVVIATAVAALAAAATAYAAINTYTATYSFTSKSAGTAAKPVPVGFTQKLTATGTNGNRTAVLLNIKSTIYGLKVDGKDFPTCSFNKISTDKNDNKCPHNALVATGSIVAQIGGVTDFSVPGANCNPLLHVWNAGQGKLVFFFVISGSHQCVGLHTGSTGPYPATYKTVGKNLVVNVPIPNYINYPEPGVAGSLASEDLVWLKHTTKVKVHGKKKTVAAIESVACKGSKRPYSTQFTATLPTAGPAKEVDTVKGSAKCKG
jgi:hypothetical protein